MTFKTHSTEDGPYTITTKTQDSGQIAGMGMRSIRVTRSNNSMTVENYRSQTRAIKNLKMLVDMALGERM